MMRGGVLGGDPVSDTHQFAHNSAVASCALGVGSASVATSGCDGVPVMSGRLTLGTPHPISVEADMLQL